MKPNPDSVLAALELAVDRGRQPRPMTVRDLMTKDIATCEPSDSLERCASALIHRRPRDGSPS